MVVVTLEVQKRHISCNVPLQRFSQLGTLRRKLEIAAGLVAGAVKAIYWRDPSQHLHELVDVADFTAIQSHDVLVLEVSDSNSTAICKT